MTDRSPTSAQAQQPKRRWLDSATTKERDAGAFDRPSLAKAAYNSALLATFGFGADFAWQYSKRPSQPDLLLEVTEAVRDEPGVVPARRPAFGNALLSTTSGRSVNE
jgi:hypothetical protein